jgi:hypothetical protein
MDVIARLIVPCLYYRLDELMIRVEKVANTLHVLTADSLLRSIITPTISLVHPIAAKFIMTITLPPTRNGRRRPQREVHLSDKAPTMGCMTSPIK